MNGLKNGTRFDYTDPALTVIRMAEGNPGAASAMMQAWRCANGLVPGMDGSAWEMIKICDELEIYGSRLYQLWSDCLGRSQEKMADCAMGYREGRISAAFIREQIRGDGCRGFRFEPGEVYCG